MHRVCPSAPPSALCADRRRLLASALTVPWLLGQGLTQAQDAPLQISQSVALTGPLGELGRAMHQGAQAAFAAINQRGGVHGRQIALTALDDGYEVARAVANVDKLLASPNCFALFGCMGTPMVEAILPQVQAAGMPLFAPFTGTRLTRTPGARHVFNIRASYADEVEKIMQHLATLRIHRLAVVYQDNSFGKEVLAEVQAAIARLKWPAVATAAVQDDGSDALAAARKLFAGNPEAVIVGLAGSAALSFMQAFRPLSAGTQVYALSVHGTPASLYALRTHAVSMAITQVVPLPDSAGTAVAREFQQAWKAHGQTDEPSHLALEGYINARTFTEALQRAGRNPTRAAFIDATWSLKKWNLGGFEINASGPEYSASQFVELTLVGRGLRLMR